MCNYVQIEPVIYFSEWLWWIYFIITVRWNEWPLGIAHNHTALFSSIMGIHSPFSFWKLINETYTQQFFICQCDSRHTVLDETIISKNCVHNVTPRGGGGHGVMWPLHCNQYENRHTWSKHIIHTVVWTLFYKTIHCRVICCTCLWV